MLVCGYSTPYGMSMKICPESVGGIRVAHRAPEWRRHHSAVKARQNRTGQMEANSGTDTGEPMKFLSLADWTGIVETELFAQTYKTYGLATVRYPVLEIEASVEPFENGRGYSLRALRAGKPRTHP